MAWKLSNQELADIATRLLTDETLRIQDANRLVDEFEENVSYPHAVDLIYNSLHEFKDLAELVAFARGEEEVKKLSRAELISVARKLMTADTENELETERLTRQFNASVPYPDGYCLIFFPKIEFKTAEELVDYALSYRPPKP